MVDEIAEILGISSDSVYRRIRGEKPIAISELKLLCDHFHISLDQVLQLQSDAVIFNTREVLEEITDFEKYLQEMFSVFTIITSFQQREMYFLCKDIMPFVFFNYPELAAFKCHFWMRHILMDKKLNGSGFSIDNFAFPEIIKLGQKITKLYNQINSIEVWNVEIISSTLNQITYYKDAGLFSSKQDIRRTYENFEKLLIHMQQMAERNVKFMPDEAENIKNGNFDLYYNEIILGNNTILAKMDEKLVTYVNFAALKFLTTRDPRFCQYSFKYFTNMVNKSSLISKSGEKERSRFFNNLHEQVERYKALV